MSCQLEKCKPPVFRPIKETQAKIQYENLGTNPCRNSCMFWQNATAEQIKKCEETCKKNIKNQGTKLDQKLIDIQADLLCKGCQKSIVEDRKNFKNNKYKPNLDGYEKILKDNKNIKGVVDNKKNKNMDDIAKNLVDYNLDTKFKHYYNKEYNAFFIQLDKQREHVERLERLSPVIIGVLIFVLICIFCGLFGPSFIELFDTKVWRWPWWVKTVATVATVQVPNPVTVIKANNPATVYQS